MRTGKRQCSSSPAQTGERRRLKKKKYVPGYGFCIAIALPIFLHFCFMTIIGMADSISLPFQEFNGEEFVFLPINDLFRNFKDFFTDVANDPDALRYIGKDYAILTNEMTKAWSGLTVQEYKQVKGLKKENLRDNMTNIELVLNMLAEVTTTAISRQEQPETFDESKAVAKRGGKVAKNARMDIEAQLGQSVISPLNASDKPALEIKVKDASDDEE